MFSFFRQDNYILNKDSFLNFILFLNFTILYWFCQISKWILHRYTCVPHPEPSSLLPPHTILLGCPSAPVPSIQFTKQYCYFVPSFTLSLFFCIYSTFPPHCSLYPIWLFPCGVISFNLNKLLSNSLSPSCMIANAFRVSFQMFYFSFILKNIYLGVEFKIGVSFF